MERQLLRSAPLRRLHFCDHNGASRITSGLAYSRLQHVLGVFALVASLCPDDAELRVAALLHDVGHAPYSHSLEGLRGVDHHGWTIRRLQRPPLSDLLAAQRLDADAVLARIAGTPANALRNRQGVAHCDHLDSWVRGAQARGSLEIDPAELRQRLRLRQGLLDTDLEAAEALAEMVAAEARFHASAANLTVAAVLRSLVGALLERGELTLDELMEGTDGTLAARLLSSPATAGEARRLFEEPYRLELTRLPGRGAGRAAAGAAAGGLPAQVERLYLDLPLVDGRPLAEVSARARALLAEAEALRGSYLVRWQHDGVPPGS